MTEKKRAKIINGMSVKYCLFCGDAEHLAIKIDDVTIERLGRKKGWYFIECDKKSGGCGCGKGDYETVEKLINSWNTRVYER